MSGDDNKSMKNYPACKELTNYVCYIVITATPTPLIAVVFLMHVQIQKGGGWES